MKRIAQLILVTLALFSRPEEGRSYDVKKFTKPTQGELKKKLTPLQYSVTQEDDTERPFKNEYWDNHKDGIYVDVVSGEPLFSSKDKYESGTGWPSFFQSLAKENLVEKTDRKFFVKRTEVRSKAANSHLGHLFDDGPQPTGLRYCMNSASLRFIAASDLDKEGYGEYQSLFAKKAAKTGGSEATAVFAGGCFWCMEPPFEHLDGVSAVISGYVGGHVKNPTYEQVSDGNTGHLEGVEVHYDPAKVSYDQLLTAFWHAVDPTDAGGQFVDRGSQYTSAIFVKSPEEHAAAENSKAALEASKNFGDKKIVTVIRDAEAFYPAEDYHQDYYKKNPVRYKYYRFNSGRDQFLEKTWGKSQ